MAVVTWQDMVDRANSNFMGRSGPIIQNPVEAKKAYTYYVNKPENANRYKKLPKAAVLERLAGLINLNLRKNKGTFVEGPGRGTTGLESLTWDKFTEKYPDFEEFLLEEYPNRVGRGGRKVPASASKVKKILTDENISSKEKWNKIGNQYRKAARNSFFAPSTELLKDTISTKELAPYTNFTYKTLKTFTHDSEIPRLKNGEIDYSHSDTNRIIRGLSLQKFLKSIGLVPQISYRGRRWPIPNEEQQAQLKTFKNLQPKGDVPDPLGRTWAQKRKYLEKISNRHSLFPDTSRNLNTLLRYGATNLNNTIKDLNNKGLTQLMQENPNMLKNATMFFDADAGKLSYTPVERLSEKNFNFDKLRRDLRFEIDHNKSVKEYWNQLSKDGKLSAKNKLLNDMNFAHNLSIATSRYNVGVKGRIERWLNDPMNQGKVNEIAALEKELGDLGHRLYAGGKWRGRAIDFKPGYRDTVMGSWGKSLEQGTGYKLSDQWKNISQKRWNLAMKDISLNPKALGELGSFLGCPSTFTGYESGGRVKLAQGSGTLKCIQSKLENNTDETLDKISKFPKKGGIFSRLKNAAGELLTKVPKSGRIGAAIAGLGAVGAGTWAMMGGAEADETMKYNATTGQFDDAEGEPETQEGILNWIADNPIKSGLAPIPIGMGAGLGAEQMGARNLGKFFTSMKFMLPPAYAAEKLYQYKQGQDLGEMFTNPLDAVWAMALDTPKSARNKLAYYTGKAAERAGKRIGPVTAAMTEAEKLGFKPSSWKNIGRATMAPRSAGTALVFPFAKGPPRADMGKMMRGLRVGARMLPLGPIPMALVAGSMAWDKYKFNQKVGDHVDALRAEGVVSEEDAETMETIYKQGWLGTTALGAKLLGSEELMFEGEMRDLDYQKMMLDQMKEFYEGREEVATKERVGDRQEDFFSWFSKGGRVGVAEGGDDFKPKGGMTRRTFLKWLVGSIAAGVAAVTGKGVKQAAKPVVKEAVKAVPTKFAGVEGMPAWFPRAVAKIKAHGKLIEMADKHYVGGDIYEMMIPVTRKYLQRSKPGEGETYVTKIDQEKVIMEENPLTGEISMHWTGTDNFGDDAVRQINFKPGEAGYQKFGVDPEHPQAWEYERVKVSDPEFTYTQPDQSNPYRDDIEYLDIFQEGDEVVSGLEKMTGGVTKEGTVVDDAFQKRIYKDLPEDEALIPDPEGDIGPEGDWLGDSPNEMIEGDVPDWVPKDEWPKKAEGGIIETGNIARRPGAVPPLSGPDPEGIMTLYSNPKQVKVG